MGYTTRGEGRQVGAAAEAKRLLFIVGGKCFGEPSQEVRARVEGISDIAALEELLSRVLDTESWDELFGK